MLTGKIEAQGFAARVLKEHIVNQRISHTYLLTGEEAAGGADLALGFACALNCLSKNYFQECECVSCRKVASKNHPDVHVLGEDEDARSIKIEEIREAIAAAALKPYEGKWKVFIFLGAERITADASNALLKTLEESPAQTVFILVTALKANMLETIQSRSFEVRLKPLTAQSPLPLGFAQELKNTPWEDYLDQAGGSRENLNQAMDHLLFYFRERMDQAAQESLPGYLDAVDALVECKDAVSGNANQKLTASRLAMRLRRALPQGIR